MPSFVVRELKEVLFLYQVEADDEGAALTKVADCEVEPFGEDHTATIWIKVEEDECS